MVELSKPAPPTAQGPVKKQLRGRVQGCVTGLAWAPQAAQLAIASAAGEFILVDFTAGVDWPLQEANAAGSKGFDALGFSSCGRWLAAAGEGGVLSLWRLDGDVPQQLIAPAVGGWIDQLAWQPDGRLLAVARGDEIWIWHSEDQVWLPPLSSPGGAVMALSWSPAGDQLAAGTGQGVWIWRLPLTPAPTHRAMEPLHLETGSAVLQLVWGSDPPWLVAGLLDRRLVLWRGLQQPMLGVGDLPGKIHALALSRLASGQQGLLVAAAEAAVVWSGQGGDLEAWNAVLLPFHLDRISALACGPAQAPIVTASRDGTAALWSEAGSLLQVLELNGQALSSVAWRADRKALAAGGEEGGWVMWPLDPDEGARA
ncbi:WD40 repeat domain-containing protein [Synechococcus sp. ATX 2A4]|uniref:WD40 repeat domain-containing protein n=1 Tax=Synechococcus sp. ATX 2A4 TaxID=2823727 RepID=UPI0020CCF639|nr:WD40 repeat domain-containing protein [Synechococcus sp. ATX 2A4]MCP9885079.1 WD40 repeat domain-containing protein [Synechococcus sp. ATX 2A4]